MSFKIRRNSCLRHATRNFLFSAFSMTFVNFDVCSIAFVVYLLNDVPFSIFVLYNLHNKLHFVCKTDGLFLKL